MKSNIENVSSLHRKVNIEVPAEVVQNTFNRIFQSIQREVAIKGFRKGKAPIATIKNMYADRVQQDVAQELIQMHYVKVLTEHKLEPISNPEFEFDTPTESKDFSFSATFDVRPEVNLKKYEGIEVDKEKFVFDDKKVEEVLQNIRTQRAALEDVTDGRAAQTGDIAIVDFEGFVDGKPLENGTGTGHQLDLGAKQFIDGFEEGVVGMKVGDHKTLNLTFPNPYHAAELAGKPVEFKVTLTGLKHKVMPELNEEFLATLGGPTNLEDLKKTIREDLESNEKKRIEDAFKNRLLKKLVQENPVDVPASLKNEQKKSLIEDFKKRMTEQGMNASEFEDYVQKWDKDFENTAAEMIQSSFLVDAIAKKHDLHAKPDDLTKKYQEYAAQTGIEEARIREFYARPEQTSRLAYMVTEEKVMELLNKSVKVKEVSADHFKDEQN